MGALLHLVGSAVDEFYADLSRLYASGCLNALADQVNHVAYISPDGRWRFPADLSDRALAQAPALQLPDAIRHILALDIEAVIPQMFCLPGMTAYRGLFDLLAIPYLGNKPSVMATAAAKDKARAIVAAAGVPVPAGAVVRRGERPTLAPPAVVKPVDADNSVGVTLVRNPSDYAAAVESALAHSDAALVETYVELGREVRCGIIVRDGELVCLPLEEYAVDTVIKPIRTREDKLARCDRGDLYLVAKDDTTAHIVVDDGPLTERVWAAARRCHIALGCRHYSLFDFRIDPSGRPWFLEAGLYCSYAPSSVIPTMAAAAGLDVCNLFQIGLSELRREGARCSITQR